MSVRLPRREIVRLDTVRDTSHAYVTRTCPACEGEGQERRRAGRSRKEGLRRCLTCGGDCEVCGKCGRRERFGDHRATPPVDWVYVFHVVGPVEERVEAGAREWAVRWAQLYTGVTFGIRGGSAGEPPVTVRAEGDPRDAETLVFLWNAANQPYTGEEEA